jgi:hypothetical protein
MKLLKRKDEVLLWRLAYEKMGMIVKKKIGFMSPKIVWT